MTSPTPGWFNPSSGGTFAGGRPRVTPGGNIIALPDDTSEQDTQDIIAAYDRAIDKNTEAWAAATGLERRQIEAKIEDMQKGREVQMQIARLQAQTSKYGVDAQSKIALDRLKEEARQYDQTHALDLMRFGLDVQKLGVQRAQTATDYLSTADRYVQASDFLNLSGQVLANQPGSNAGSGAVPQAKTMADYAALEGGARVAPGRQVDASAGAGLGSSSGADARVKALRAVIDASPPSPDQGLDPNAYHVLNAARAIYSMDLNPMQQAQIRGNKQYGQILASAGRRLGYNPADWDERQAKNLPGQQPVGAY